MQTLRWPWLWLGIGWLLIATVVVLSLLPAPDLPSVSWSDKVSHFIAYGAMSGWYTLIFRSWQKQLRNALLLIVLGGVLEVVQGMTGERYAEWADMLANAVGVILGAVLIRLCCPNLLLRLEALLQRSR